jgi:N-acyl-D-amino-acid deacylase
MNAKFDMIVSNGLIHDGLCTEPFTGDIGIRDGRIVAIGKLAEDADEILDASGLMVTPGFVDIHTHYDGQVTWENRMAPSSGHGVTTVLIGNCGVGFAPCRPDQREMLVKVMEGVEDIPEVVMTEGLPWSWETFPEYLDVLEGRSFDIDVATQAPHSAIRVYVMGERAVTHEPPTAEDLAAMRALTAQAVRAGAFGVSTSRNLMHRTVAGGLAPSLYSELDELLALGGGLKDAGSGVFQLIPGITAPAKDEFALIRKIVEESERPLSFSLLQLSTGDPDQWKIYLEALDQAKKDDLPILAQVAPRPVGMLYGLDLSFHPFALNPSFRSLRNKTLAEKVSAMRDPALRKQLLSEQPEDSNPVSVKTAKNFKFGYVLGDPPRYEPHLSERIDHRAAALGVSPEELAYDLLLQNDGSTIIYNPGANYRDNNLDAVREMLGHPQTIVALADGGAHYGMICDGSFPTYFLIRWGRDASGEQRIPLTDVVASLTSKPANAVGLFDRGRIKVGAKADLNVINLAQLRLRAPEIHQDLPAGGKRLAQVAEGYNAVVVSGVVTYRNGIPTGALPGKLVRNPARASTASAG